MTHLTTPAAIDHAHQIVKAYMDESDEIATLLHEADRSVVMGLTLIATSAIRLLSDAENQDPEIVLPAISSAASDAVRTFNESETQHE